MLVVLKWMKAQQRVCCKSATALIFQKYDSDEGSCKFVESVDLPTAAADWTDDTTGGITTTSKSW